MPDKKSVLKIDDQGTFRPPNHNPFLQAGNLAQYTSLRVPQEGDAYSPVYLLQIDQSFGEFFFARADS